MKTKIYARIIIPLTFALMLLSCSSFKGSASDRTGTNGATNGTGEIFTGTRNK